MGKTGIKTMFRAVCAIALTWLMCTSVFAAQKTKAQLSAEITAQLPSSGQGQITAAILRAVLQDMVDSDQQIMLLNQQTGTTYTFLAGDQGKLVTFSNVAAVGATLPQAVGDFGGGYNVLVQNLGAGAVTITPTLSTINGGATLTLNQNQVALIVSAGLNVYRAITYGLMSSVTCGAGLSGGVITTNGTCSITDTISSGNTVGSSALIPVITFNTRGQITAAATASMTPGSLGLLSPLSVLGNVSATSSPASAVTYSQFADTISNQRGVMLFRGNSVWQAIGPCVAGQIPQFGGTGADMACATVTGTGTVTSIVQGAGLVFSTTPLTAAGTISADFAANSNIWAATANKVVGSDILNTAGNPVTISHTVSPITLNLASGVDFQVTLNTTPVFANPTVTSSQLGRTGCIWITQPTTTYYAISSFGSNWKFANGVAPTLTTTLNAVDVLCYKARSTTFVWGVKSASDVR